MKFDTKLIGYITLFENYTRANVKDCFFRDKELVFIVQEGHLGRAVGKNGIHIKRFSLQLKHKLRIIEFNKDPLQFLGNLFYPLQGYALTIEDKKILLKPDNKKVKGQIFGRDKSNFIRIKDVFHRHFSFDLVIE